MRSVRVFVVALLGAAVVLAGCNGGKYGTKSGDEEFVYLGFEAITPVLSSTYTDYTTSAEGIPHSWPTAADAVRKLLPDMHTRLTVQQVDAGGRLTYLAGVASLKKGSYVITVDAFRYRPEPVLVSAGICKKIEKCSDKLDAIQVGVGVRLQARVDVIEGKADTASLLPLGIEVHGGKTAGTMEFSVIGIAPHTVSLIVPSLTLKLDENTLQTMLQAMTVLLSKMDGTDVSLTPHIIGVKSNEPPKGAVSSSRIVALEGGARAKAAIDYAVMKNPPKNE